VLAIACLSWAQQQPAQQPQQPSSPGAASPGNVPSTPSPGTTPGRDRTPFPDQTDPRRQDERTTFPTEMQRPIFLSGKVLMDDGTPPPDSVVIERVCNGVARPEAYTDSKGRFSFQLGQNMSMMADASVSSADPFGSGPGTFDSRSGSNRSSGMGRGMGGVTEQQLMGCELRATLAGYRSEIVNLAGRRFMDNPDVGTIIMRRLGNVEGLTISATSALAPKDARKAYDKGREAFGKKKWENSQKELEKAVQIYPKYAAAWHQLGLLYEQQNNVEQARKAYSEALAADGKFVSPYMQLAQLAARERKWEEVRDTTDRVTKLNPFDFPVAYFYNAVAQLNLQNLDAAEKSAREALKIDEQHRIPKISHVLGIILAQKRDYSGAAEHIRSYLKFAPNAGDVEMAKKQLAELEGVAGSQAATPAAQPQP
jgi:tetratricopeptide (TPR) repeat protein